MKGKKVEIKHKGKKYIFNNIEAKYLYVPITFRMYNKYLVVPINNKDAIGILVQKARVLHYE